MFNKTEKNIIRVRKYPRLYDTNRVNDKNIGLKGKICLFDKNFKLWKKN